MAELVYDHDDIQLWHGDNADVRPEPTDVNLVLTDPPYGIALDTDYSKFRDAGYVGPKYLDSVAGDDRPFDPSWLLDYQRVFIWGANHFANMLPAGGSWFIWDKITRNDITVRQAHGEVAWTNCGGKNVEIFRHMWSGAFRDSERGFTVHPTQKPVELMRMLVDRWTEPGDLVYDPYMGSGPVAQACADLGRRYIGVELEREYVDAAFGRLSQQTLALA